MSTKRKAHPELPAEIGGVIEKIRRAQPGFDVVRGWVDSPSPNFPMNEIGKLCGGGADLTLGTMKFGGRWGSHVQLFQPSRAALALFNDAAGERYAVHLSYVEFAWDFITSTQADADEVATFLVEHLYVPYMRQEVVLDKGTTWYWNRLTDANGNKVDRNLALYASMPSKQAGTFVGRHCAHLEFRLNGGPELAKHGIVGPQDLLHLNHLTFWDERVRLLRPKSLTDLGRWLGGDASGTMLRKRAHAFRSDFSTSGVFVLQDALLNDRKLLGALIPIDLRRVFVGRRGMAEA